MAEFDDLEKELARIASVRSGKTTVGIETRRSELAAPPRSLLRPDPDNELLGKPLKRSSGWLPVVAGTLSVITFAGIVWFAYTQGIRTGSESSAPMIVAQGPIKVKPSDPGGVKIPDQDRLVLQDAGVAREASAKARLIQGDSQLSSQAIAKIRETLPDVPENRSIDALLSPDQPLAKEPIQTNTVASLNAGLQAGSDAKPLPPIPPALPRLGLDGEAQPIEETSSPDIASLGKLSPELNIGGGVNSGQGNWRIQIAALRSESAARAEWRRLANQFPVLMRPLQLSIESVEIAGQGTYYRVRGGSLESRNAATQVCDALKENRVDCLVVRPGR